jgi:hypothetical protein
MLSNRSIPHATVIPVLAYPGVNQAAAWLCDAFGFNVRLRQPAYTLITNRNRISSPYHCGKAVPQRLL